MRGFNLMQKGHRPSKPTRDFSEEDKEGLEKMTLDEFNRLSKGEQGQLRELAGHFYEPLFFQYNRIKEEEEGRPCPIDFIAVCHGEVVLTRISENWPDREAQAKIAGERGYPVFIIDRPPGEILLHHKAHHDLGIVTPYALPLRFR